MGIPGSSHTTRVQWCSSAHTHSGKVGFELATNCIQLYDVAKLKCQLGYDISSLAGKKLAKQHRVLLLN